MKFKQITETQGKVDIINLVLENRNIPHMDNFLNAEKLNEETDSSLMLNMEAGVKLYLEHIEKESVIGVLVDSDADGKTSGASMFSYTNKNFSHIDVRYIVHDTKAHGITKYAIEKIKDSGINLLIVPDSGSNDVEHANILKDMGIDLIVIDHHPVTTPIEYGVLINNQLCDYSNKNFTGVGMVYKFLQLVDKLNERAQSVFANDFLDLVAIGQIGDSSDISDPEIRKLVVSGLKNMRNGFVRTAVLQDVGLMGITPKELSFSIIPVINAVTRVGTVEERELLFEAMADINPDRQFIVQKKKKNKDTGKFDTLELTFTLYQQAYDVSKKVKSRQDSAVKKMLPIIEEKIDKDLSVIVAISNNKEMPGISGLVANKLVNKYDKPAILFNDKDKTFSGSGRGCEKVIADFRKWCEDTQLFEFAQGHDNAFGLEIRKENYDLFIEYIKNNLEQIDEIEYEVDILVSSPSKEDCEKVYINRDLFGGSVSEPLIGLQNLKVPRRFISNRGAVLNIFSWGVTIVKFSTNEELLEEIKNYPNDEIVFNIVGTYSMNNWGGRLSPQLVVKDIELVYNHETSEYNNNIDENGELIF